MGCGCGGNKIKRAAQTAVNLAKAAVAQPDIVKWFKDGVNGIVKCIGGQTLYSDEVITAHRDICRTCPHSTKTDGKLTLNSQCMAPDPAKQGAPCGCIITCKTQVGTCPLNKWTNITINGNHTGV